MKINVTSPSRLASLSNSSETRSKMNNTALQLNRDSFNLSGLASNLAGKLRTSGDYSITDAATETDPTLKLMNRSMKEVGNLLEEMKTLAEQAQDESLSDEDRIDMQIQMTKLQAQLYRKTYGMSLEMAGKESDLFRTSQLNAIDYDEELTIKMLERERARIRSGGTTDGEGTLLVEDRVKLRIENGPETWGLTEGTYDAATGTFVPGKAKEDLGEGTYAVTGRNAQKMIESGEVLTDEERMARNSLSLMDTKSAKASTEKIEKRIQGLTDMQAELKEADAASKNAASGDANYSILGGTQSENSVMTSLGMMKATQDEYGKNPLKGRDLDAADVRLQNTQDPMGKMFQKLDAFFKDKVHQSLGLGGMWDSAQNVTYA